MKQRYLFLSIFLSLFFVDAFAQTTGETKPSVFKKMEWRVGAGAFWHDATPDINYKPERFGVFEGFNTIGGQFLFDIELNDRLGFTTGFKISSGNIFSDSVNYPTTRYPEQWTRINYDFTELEIPLRVRYYISTGKIRPFVDFSISLNRFLDFTYSGTNFVPFFFPPPEGQDFSQAGEPRNNASYDIGGGLYVDLGKNLSLMLDARYQLAEYYWGFRREIVMQRPVISAAIFWRIRDTVWRE